MSMEKNSGSNFSSVVKAYTMRQNPLDMMSSRKTFGIDIVAPFRGKGGID